MKNRKIILGSEEDILASEVRHSIEDEGFIIGYLNDEVAASVIFTEDKYYINTLTGSDEFDDLDSLLIKYSNLTFKYYN